MTNREFFENVIANMDNEEMVEKAKSLLDALDRRNAKRAERPSKTALANEPMLASEIAQKIKISTQKASALLRQMDVKVTDVKVKGKGTQKGYFIAE